MSKQSAGSAERMEGVMYSTVDEWIHKEAISLSLDPAESFNRSIDRIMASLDPAVQLLGFGEGLHVGMGQALNGAEDILVLRNRLFQHLVEAHGYSAIAVESSFTRGHFANEYVLGHGPDSYEEVKETGFNHGFGHYDANRELIEWMRQYNADPAHSIKVHFYGFDTPTEMMYSDSPRHVMSFVLDYLASVEDVQDRRGRIEGLLGQDVAWETEEAAMNPSKSIGLSAAAVELRIEAEELIMQLTLHRPDLIAKSGQSSYLRAMRYATIASELLTYHATVARDSADRFMRMLSIRDAAMANNLDYIVTQEQSRGKVLAFAHNSHLRHGQADWQLGPNLHTWWPAGAHLNMMLGARYAVIATGVGMSEANGIGQPEDGTLEARLTAAPGPMRFIPTHKGQHLSESVIAALPIRTGSAKNPSYFPFTHQSFTDFNGLLVLDSIAYKLGGPTLS